METAKETLTIQTPEQVGFKYLVAGLGTRATAFLLDTALRLLVVLFIFVAVTLLLKPLLMLDPSGLVAWLSFNWILALAVLAYGVVDLGYFLLFEALWSGQTPGKRMQNLRVVRVNGQPIGWLESSIRNILRAVDMLFGFYPLGLLIMFLSERSQRIGDYAAGTVVIVERKQRVPMDRTGLLRGADLNLPDIELYLSTLEPQQYQLLRSFLQRRDQMNPRHRRQLATVLAYRLMKRWGISPSPDIPNEPFLEEVVRVYERSKKAI